jgi:hypothetical protein
MSYKRNQIEGAIARLFAPNCKKLLRSCARASSGCLNLTVPLAATFDLKMLKRPTLDFSARRHPGPEPLFSFSEYEAFALLNGLRIMEHGWPQGFAVSIMRRVRLDLEREHARILQQCPGKLFDQQAIRSRTRPGDIAVDNTDPVFLTIASKEKRAADEGQTAPLSAVCQGMEQVSNSVAI